MNELTNNELTMQSCIFCKIITGEIPSKLIYRDDNFVAFHDISPKAPTHVLVVPVKHIESIRDIQEKDKELIGELFLKVRHIAKKVGISDDGYKVVINNGKGAGQLVFHLHIHVLGGWSKSPEWQV